MSGYKYKTEEEAREAHRQKARERAQLDSAKERRKVLEQNKREYVKQLEIDHKNLQIMYQQLLQHTLYLQSLQQTSV